MKTRQQAKQVEEAAGGGNKSNVMRHKGHDLKDGSKGRPHYQTEGKKGHSMWGKLGTGAATVGGGLAASDNAEASSGTSTSAEANSGITWKDVGNFMIDLIVPGGVAPLGEGSDKVPEGGYRRQPPTTDQ